MGKTRLLNYLTQAKYTYLKNIILMTISFLLLNKENFGWKIIELF